MIYIHDMISYQHNIITFECDLFVLYILLRTDSNVIVSEIDIYYFKLGSLLSCTIIIIDRSQ